MSDRTTNDQYAPWDFACRVCSAVATHTKTEPLPEPVHIPMLGGSVDRVQHFYCVEHAPDGASPRSGMPTHNKAAQP